MRITFISPTVNMGGGTRVVVIYAERLMRMGHPFASFRRHLDLSRLFES